MALVGLLGAILAVVAGCLATTQYGVWVLAGIIVVAFLILGVVTYLRDPVLALLGLWIFEVFDLPASAALGNFSSAAQTIKQADELLVLLLLCLTLRNVLRTTIPLPPLRFVAPGVGIAVAGLISAIMHEVPLSIALTGGVLGLKLWIMIVIALMLPWRVEDIDRAYKALTTVGVIVAIIGLGDYLAHGALSHALHTTAQAGYRGEAVQSIFPTPGEYSLFMSLLFGLTFSRFTRSYNAQDLFLALLFAASIILSLRLKGFLSLTAVAAIVGIVTSATSPRRAVAALLIGALLIFGGYHLEQAVISKQVGTYTSSETSARSRLYTTSEQIASENFPLGLGFGRFASYMSRAHYSPAYYEYGLSRVYGLSPQFPSFIEDTSWPSVLGETGYGGAAFYIGGILFIIAAMIQRLRTWPTGMRWLPLAGLCSIAVLLLDSLGDPALFSWMAVTTVAIIFAPLIVLQRLRSQP